MKLTLTLLAASLVLRFTTPEQRRRELSQLWAIRLHPAGPLPWADYRPGLSQIRRAQERLCDIGVLPATCFGFELGELGVTLADLLREFD